MGKAHDHGLGAAGASVADRFDPRARLVSMAVWIGLAAWMSDPFGLSVLMAVLLVMSVVSGAGVTRVLARLGSLTVALIPAWAVLPLFGPKGDELMLGPLVLHSTGLASASILQARACAIILVVMLLQGGTPWNRWVWAAGKLGVPASLLNLFAITLRYLPILSAEGARTMTAARARGFEPSATARGYKALASMAGAGMVRSFKRSERLYLAMLARGYSGRFHPLSLTRAGAGDFAFALVSVAMAAAVVMFEAGYRP